MSLIPDIFKTITAQTKLNFLNLRAIVKKLEDNINYVLSGVGIDHQTLSGSGTNTHSQIDSHISDSDLHFSETSIDHNNIQNKGTNTHQDIDNFITSKGQANGLASLDGSGLVSSSQLPSFVDDVLEYADFDSLPVTGETSKIYVTLDDNYTYRWSGSGYINISSAGNSDYALNSGKLGGKLPSYYATASSLNNYNPTIGTDTDLITNEAEVIDTLTLTNGVITNATKRTLTLAQLGFDPDDKVSTDSNQALASTNPLSLDSYKTLKIALGSGTDASLDLSSLRPTHLGVNVAYDKYTYTGGPFGIGYWRKQWESSTGKIYTPDLLVGIGTDKTLKGLTVSNGENTIALADFSPQASGIGPAIWATVSGNANGDSYVTYKMMKVSKSNSTVGNYDIDVILEGRSNTGSLCTNQLFLEHTGDVIIGSDTPINAGTSDNKLQIYGDINLTDGKSLYVNGVDILTNHTHSYNPTIGTDTDLITNEAEVIDTLTLTNGVITNATKRTLTLAQLGFDPSTKVSTVSNQALHSTDALSLSDNNLSLNKADGTSETVDLSGYASLGSSNTFTSYVKATGFYVTGMGHIRTDYIKNQNNFNYLTFGGSTVTLGSTSYGLYLKSSSHPYVVVGSNTYNLWHGGNLSNPVSDASYVHTDNNFTNTYKTYATNGNTAYGWENHATQGYAKSSGNNTFTGSNTFTSTTTFRGSGGFTLRSTDNTIEKGRFDNGILGYSWIDGKLAINSALNPSYDLHVNGTANATTLYENGTTLSSKYVSTNSVQALDSTDALSFSSNILYLNKADGTNENVNLSGYVNSVNSVAGLTGTITQSSLETNLSNLALLDGSRTFTGTVSTNNSFISNGLGHRFACFHDTNKYTGLQMLDASGTDAIMYLQVASETALSFNSSTNLMYATYSLVPNGNNVSSLGSTSYFLEIVRTITLYEGNISLSSKYHPLISSPNTAFNKNFGTTSGTVAEGNHNHNSTYLGISSNAVSASKLQTARTITLSGDVSGSASFDGSTNIDIDVTVSGGTGGVVDNYYPYEDAVYLVDGLEDESPQLQSLFGSIYSSSSYFASSLIYFPDQDIMCVAERNSSDTANDQMLGFCDMNFENAVQNTSTGVDRPTFAMNSNCEALMYENKAVMVSAQAYFNNGAIKIADMSNYPTISYTAVTGTTNISFCDRAFGFSQSDDIIYALAWYTGNYAEAPGAKIAKIDITNATCTYVDFTSAVSSAFGTTADDRFRMISKLQTDDNTHLVMLWNGTNQFLTELDPDNNTSLNTSDYLTLSTITGISGSGYVWYPNETEDHIYFIPNINAFGTGDIQVLEVDKRKRITDSDFYRMITLSPVGSAGTERGKIIGTGYVCPIIHYGHFTGKLISNYEFRTGATAVKKLVYDIYNQEYYCVDVGETTTIDSDMTDATNDLFWNAQGFVAKDQSYYGLANWRDVSGSGYYSNWYRHPMKIFRIAPIKEN